MNIACKEISVEISGKKIVKSVSMRGEGNRFIGVIGPNGSGKSTLLKCMYRVLKPSGGTVYLDNTAIESLSYRESAQKLAVVAQHNYYNFDFTVQEVVMIGRAPHKRAMERDNARDFEIVRRALEKVEMQGYRDRIFSTLSGGEQQRIILARALAQNTKCLILDEPTNHLDVKYQLQILDVVKSMDLTVITALHDLNIAAMYCDYLYILKDGELKYKGTPRELFKENIIKEIYEVDAKIMEDESGALHVFYKRASR